MTVVVPTATACDLTKKELANVIVVVVATAVVVEKNCEEVLVAFWVDVAKRVVLLFVVAVVVATMVVVVAVVVVAVVGATDLRTGVFAAVTGGFASPQVQKLTIFCHKLGGGGVEE